jgi:YbgC/YbaW family acyl-CoA thioester hydrolase
MAAERILEKQLESTAIVRFQDCDPYRHLNNARYIDYFMNARDDQLKQFYDFDLFGFTQKTNQAWVVSRNHIAYLSPAMMQEQVIICTQLIQMSENTLVVEGQILDQEGRRLKALMWIEFTFIDLLTGRTAKHPDDLMDLFRTVVVEDVYEPDAFNRRADELKAQFRKQPTPQG